MIFVSPPKAVKLFYDELIWSIPTTEKVIYLTFDDGPVPEVTPWVLNQLKQYNAKATFFCIGENVKNNPTIYQRILADNHTVGNHTNNHLNGWKTKTGEYINNVEECRQVVTSNLFRPPYGMIKKAQIKQLKYSASNTSAAYSIIMWDVLSYDYDQNIPAEKVLENVISKTKPGSIIVFHDSLKAQKNMQFALPQVLKYFSEQGFSFNGIAL